MMKECDAEGKSLGFLSMKEKNKKKREQLLCGWNDREVD